MWLVGTETLDFYIGTRAVARCDTENDSDGAPDLRCVDSFDQSLDVVGSWLDEATRRHAVRVWLSGGLCRPFLLPSVAGVKGKQEWRQAATALAPQRTGLLPPCQVWMDDEGAADGRIVVAVQDSTLERLLLLLEARRTRRHRLVSIAPWWAQVLREALRREQVPRVVAVQDCDSLTVLAGAAPGAFLLASTVAPVFDAGAADAAMARLLMSLDVEPGEEVVARLKMQGNAAGRSGSALSALTEWSR